MKKKWKSGGMSMGEIGTMTRFTVDYGKVAFWIVTGALTLASIIPWWIGLLFALYSMGIKVTYEPRNE